MFHDHQGLTSPGCAAQEAVYAAREDGGLGTEFLRMDSPATPERLRMACADHLTAPFAPPDHTVRTSC